MGKLDQYKIAEEPFYQSQADEIEMYKAAYTNRMPVMLKGPTGTILAECKACHDANPDNHVRLIGYDNYAQSQGASMVIYRGKGFK